MVIVFRHKQNISAISFDPRYFSFLTVGKSKWQTFFVKVLPVWDLWSFLPSEQYLFLLYDIEQRYICMYSSIYFVAPSLWWLALAKRAVFLFKIEGDYGHGSCPLYQNQTNLDLSDCMYLGIHEGLFLLSSYVVIDYEFE